MTGYFGYSFTVMSITTELGWWQYLMDRTVSSFRIVIGMEEEEEDKWGALLPPTEARYNFYYYTFSRPNSPMHEA